MHNASATRARSRTSQRVCRASLPEPLCLSVIPASYVVPPSADIISTVEFDSTGNYLATGDKGGRVVLFERNEMVRRLTATA